MEGALPLPQLATDTGATDPRGPWSGKMISPIIAPQAGGPAGTALRRQGRAVARAAGPRHHRPRLRHETHNEPEAQAVIGDTIAWIDRALR